MALSAYKKYGRAADLMKKAILSGQPAQAYIIEGDNIIDKKAFALAFAKALFCRVEPGEGCDSCSICLRLDHGNYEDLYYVSGDERTGNLRDSSIRRLQEELFHQPSGEGGRNFAIIDDADSMTSQAQSRLLKTLEEPIPGTVILLLSTNSANLFPTIRSRCVTYRLEDTNPGELSDSEFVEEGEDYLALAEKLLSLAVKKDYFYKIKDTFENSIKERKQALTLLDAFQRLVRESMISEDGMDLSIDTIAGYMALIEKTRREIRQGMSYKYAVKNMLLEMSYGKF